MTLPDLGFLRARLGFLPQDERRAGRDVDDAVAALAGAPESYDALDAVARLLAASPMRDDWPYVEPDDLDSIWRECDPDRPLTATSVPDAGERVRAAFEGSVCGCMLGKPVEMNPTLEDRWLAPFRDRIRLSMAMTWISSLSELTARMAALPGRIRT